MTLQKQPPHARTRLRLVKTVHTVIWAFFAGCIFAIPVAALLGQLLAAVVLAAVVMVEVMVLLLNQMRCPLTAVAAAYTDNREPNFDIYLPRWVARNNKLVFGALYAAGLALTAIVWLTSRAS
ncbi:MAG: hypothetical protein IPP14_01020 [Planctomycetes bacterium]|nr:hypothetical protein [Planctomycetota bacterium]